MKRSLSIISLLLICCVWMACQSKPKTRASKNNTTGSANTSTTKKDTSKSNNDNKAVIHGTQNQAQLDSVKATKTKAKK